MNDPKLMGLIEQAVEANLDLQAAAARVQEARSLVGVAAGRYWPDTVVDGSYSRNEPSDNGALGQVLPPGQSFSASGLYNVGIGFNWEIDVFGRIRRTVEAASANLEASIEDYRDLLVILIADVAANYVEVRTVQLRIEYADKNVEAQRETLKITQDRFNAGLTSARDVAQAESNLANSRASIPTLQTRQEAAVNRLAVLLGKVPGAVDQLLNDAPNIPEPDKSVAVGMPAELLRRRPDIRRAERLLASQNAFIGVAKADLYPTFSLGGVLALESGSSGNLFDSDSTTWSLVPGLRWNVFNGGRVRSQIQVEEARTEQALRFYEQSVLLALEEVENTLVAYEREKVRRERLKEAVDATERTVQLVRTQYLSGLTDFQSYLDAQRSLISQQDNLVASEGQVVQNLIALNRALGGGWTPPDPETHPMDVASEIYGEDDSSEGNK
jgi:NodT family efflux transporter outer membrane factor (OMF) lipoprotein